MAHLSLGLRTIAVGVAVEHGGSLFWKEVCRIHGRTVHCWIHRCKVGHLLLSLPMCDGIAPLKAAGTEKISMALCYSKDENANSWQRGNGWMGFYLCCGILKPNLGASDTNGHIMFQERRRVVCWLAVEPSVEDLTNSLGISQYSGIMYNRTV